MTAGPGAYAVLSAVVFGLGLAGLLVRSDAAGLLTAAVLLTSGSVIALVGFTHTGGGSFVPASGDALAVVALLGLGGEAVLGGGLAMLLWRRLRAAAADAVSPDAEV